MRSPVAILRRDEDSGTQSAQFEMTSPNVGDSASADPVRPIAVGPARTIPTRRYKLRWRMTAAAVATVLALVVSEFAYRRFLRQRYKSVNAGYTNPVLQLDLEDPIKAFSFRPNVENRSRTHDAPDAPWWTFSTNSFGLRDEEEDVRQPGAPAIMCLGDSYTFGWAISEDDGPFPHILQQLLRSSQQRFRDAEVYNVGIPGYNTEQESIALAFHGARLKPRVIILGYVMNDAEPQSNVPPPPDQTFRDSRSWLYESLKSVFRERLGLGWGLFASTEYVPRDYVAGFSSDSPRWRRSKAALSAMWTWAREHDATLLVCIWPDFTQPFDGRYRYLPIHHAVNAWCAEMHVSCLDLWTAFFGKNHRDWQVPFDGHPNGKAHRAVAQILCARLAALFPRN